MRDLIVCLGYDLLRKGVRIDSQIQYLKAVSS